MDQTLALEIMLSGKNVLLTGPAGSGKTYVLSQFIRLSRAAGKSVAVTATTGLAATHLSGTTLHSWAGIGVSDSLETDAVEHMSKSRRDIILKTDVLIIDEISMLHDFRLDMVDEVCRQVRGKTELPFGGIQVVMSGDFFQLPPINRGDSRSGGFVFGSRVWSELDPAICYLDEQHRQDSDDRLLEVLTNIRRGDVSEGDVEDLLSRVVEPGPEEEMTELHVVNADVDAINELRLKAIDDEEYSYSQASSGAKGYVDTLRRSVLAPETLRLKRGALVMTVKNSADKKYVNGSVGTVIDFEEGTGYPIVEFKNGRVATILPDTWELRDGETKRASITQVPLRLAWAITVHKSQGMTLDMAKVDLRKAFVAGMGYVALSRVKKLFDLYLVGINNRALQVSEEALRVDEALRQRSMEGAATYAYLRERVTDVKAAPTSESTGKIGWKQKIEKMRQTHPNAYKPWTTEDDATLKQLFVNGAEVSHIARQLGRHDGSIVARLKKHYGDDMIQM